MDLAPLLTRLHGDQGADQPNARTRLLTSTFSLTEDITTKRLCRHRAISSVSGPRFPRFGTTLRREDVGNAAADCRRD